MATLATSGLHLPHDVAAGMIKKAADAAIAAQLSAREAFRFGETDFVTLNDVPKAEFVGEGVQKSSTGATFGIVTAKPRKAQVTMRFNEEVQWADEDHQLGVLSTLADAGAEAMARALDLGLIHGINPLTGAALAGSPAKVADAASVITSAGKPETEIETAIGALIGANGYPTGVALTPQSAFQIATMRDSNGRKINPEMSLNPAQLGSLNGLPSVASNLVSAPEAAEADAKNIVAIVGDWAAGVRWGVARELPVELIRFGDPDGQGDLKRQNQIALRLETVFVWYVDPTKFALVKSA